MKNLPIPCPRDNRPLRVIEDAMREADRIRAERGLHTNEEALKQEQEAT